MRWVGNVELMEDMKNYCKMLAGKPEGKRPLRGPMGG
jgi:hypothetical protein